MSGPPTWVTNKFQYQKIASEIEPAARLSTKDSQLWKIAAAVVMVVTFGRVGYRRFLDDFATTFGPLQAYPRGWPRLGRRLLVHECTHTRQCVWFGWLVPIAGWFFGRRVRAWCGLPFFGVLYLLVFFFLGLAYFRYRFELHADVVSWRWALRHDGWDAGMIKVHADERAGDVGGSSYGWSWPKPLVRRGYERSAAGVIAEHGK